MPKHKHLTLEERQTIESLLNDNKSISIIAEKLGKSISTVSREITKHVTFVRNGIPGRGYNNCKHRFHCTKVNICERCTSPKHYKYCSRCSMCNNHCPDYIEEICSRYTKPPYVCNGCGKRPECILEKHVYSAAKAEESYHTILSESRSGTTLSEEEISLIDSVVSPLVKQNQSPHHISIHNRDVIMISERTVYRLINDNLISAINLDLPRKVRFKSRKFKRRFKVDQFCRNGRDYAAYLNFREKHPDIAITELDSVEGVKGGKVLLTIHLVNCEMMLAFLRRSNDSRSVTDIVNRLYEKLGPDLFSQIFSVFLTDNGSEFSNPTALEFDSYGIRRCHVFYCDPDAPYQKGSAERNHEFIRCFIPKGTDIGLYSQSDISLMMNNINSYARKSLGNKSPYEMFQFLYGNEALSLLECSTIPANSVTLNKSVFRKEASV